jgi:hypothetical protein
VRVSEDIAKRTRSRGGEDVVDPARGQMKVAVVVGHSRATLHDSATGPGNGTER